MRGNQGDPLADSSIEQTRQRDGNAKISMIFAADLFSTSLGIYWLVQQIILENSPSIASITIKETHP